MAAPSVTGASSARLYGLALIIVVAVFVAYANALKAPFVFDDFKGIRDNPSIRDLGDLPAVLSPPPHVTGAAGRPLVNFSLAVNYALGGLDVRGYHAVNFMLHAAAALVLFGLVRRTLQRPELRSEFAGASLSLAFGVALLWALHPLLTESVTGVIQRSEILGGLFCLLTLYTFVRSLDSPRPARWRMMSVAVCLIGMTAKEIMAAAPVLVLLYDRAFVAGSFKSAWRERKGYYLALATTWLLLAWLIAGHAQRGGSVGFGLGISAWHYALTQCQAIVLYLQLAFWPHPLTLDYGTAVVEDPGEVWLQGLLVLTLVAGTFAALARRPRLGWVMFAFFAILFPSSSFIPLTTQTMAEHRMYLPLAAVVTMAVLGAFRYLGPRTLVGVPVLALLAGAGSMARNHDYRSAVALWSDTVAQQPENPRARLNLGSSFLEAGLPDEAEPQFQAVIRLQPGNTNAHFNLGNLQMGREQFAAAVGHYQRALELRPDHAMAHYSLGYCLLRLGRTDEALTHYATAERIKPDELNFVRSHGSALLHSGRPEVALPRYETAVRLAPQDGGLRGEYGVLLATLGRLQEARGELEIAVQLAPRDVPARYGLALVLLRMDQWTAAAGQFAEVVRLAPKLVEARTGYARALLRLGRTGEARIQLESALRIRPDSTEVRALLQQLPSL